MPSPRVRPGSCGAIWRWRRSAPPGRCRQRCGLCSPLPKPLRGNCCWGRCGSPPGASPRGKLPAPPPKYGGTKKDLQKQKRACQHHGVCCIIQTYQSESTGALGLLSENGRHCVMANPSRKKRKRKASVVGAVLKLLFLLLLLSMLAAYIANQVALSSKSGAGHPAGADRPAEDPERGDAAHPQRRLGRCDRSGLRGTLTIMRRPTSASSWM